MNEWKLICSLKFSSIKKWMNLKPLVFYHRKGEHWNRIIQQLFWSCAVCRVHIAAISDSAFIAVRNYVLKCKLNWATVFLHCHVTVSLIALCNSNWYAMRTSIRQILCRKLDVKWNSRFFNHTNRIALHCGEWYIKALLILWMWTRPIIATVTTRKTKAVCTKPY